MPGGPVSQARALEWTCLCPRAPQKCDDPYVEFDDLSSPSRVWLALRRAFGIHTGGGRRGALLLYGTLPGRSMHPLGALA